MNEKTHIDEKEFQKYCAYKHIEQQIKGCLDREKELKKKLENKEKEICKEIWQEFEKRLMNKKGKMDIMEVAHMINSVICFFYTRR